MIRAVFFDVGHTLLRVQPSVGDLYAREAAVLGANAEPGNLARVFSKTFSEMSARLAASTVGIRASDDQEREMWRTVVRQVHAAVPALHSIDADRWHERLDAVFARPDVWSFYPDAEPTLHELRRRGFRLGVISNWSTRLRGIAEGMGLGSLVDFLVISAEVGVAKPDPRIFRRALELAEVRPEEAMHVGDLVDYDVRGAQAAGIHPVLLSRGDVVVQEAEGVSCVRDLRELLAIVPAGA